MYWTDGANVGTGAVRKCAVGGCNGKATTIASGLNDPVAVEVDDTSVYWAEQGTYGAADGRIWMAPK